MASCRIPQTDTDLSSLGKIEFNDDTIQVNEEFQAYAIDVAELLDLDQLEAARLLYIAFNDKSYDRSPLYTAVLLFHTYRVFLLDCLRLCTHYASANNEGDSTRVPEIKAFCLQVFAGDGRDASFFTKCLAAMEDIEQWLARIAIRLNALQVIDAATSVEAGILELQQDRLVRQHEALAEIMTDFEDFASTSQDNLQRMVEKAKKLEKYDVIAIHYMAPLSNMLFHFGTSEQRLVPEEAQRFHDEICSTAEARSWKLRHFQAVMKTIWVSSYAARFQEAVSANRKDELADRFTEALADGAFEFLLLVCREIKHDDWYEPARHELTDFLLKDSNTIHLESCAVGPRFHRKFLECLQDFVDSFVSNLPDTIRRLKLEEDNQRRILHSQLQGHKKESFNLEQFLVIISYAYEGFPNASASFWTDPESNLNGFLVWSSQRLSTPRAAAFCVMLISLSEPGAELQAADAAHQFLAAEMTQPAARLRRSSPLSWATLYEEISFYAERIRTHLQAHANPASNQYGRPDASNYEEPESIMMLESYLRLMTHLSKASPEARAYLLSAPDAKASNDLLYLCSPLSKPRLRACGFDALQALLVDKTREHNDLMWFLLDDFIWRRSISTRPLGSYPLDTEQAFFASLHDPNKPAMELPSAFVHLLSSMTGPSQDANATDALPFPENLGSSYRIGGIDGYVDYVFDRVFCWSSTLDLVDPTLLRIMRLRCVDFIRGCLASFNENLVIFADTAKVNVAVAMHVSSVQAYLQLHPFVRTMEWFFNERAIKALFDTANQDVEEVDSSEEDSPLVLATVHAIEVINLVLKLQSTYLHIVKPKMQEKQTNHRPQVANLAFATFEDAILNHLSFVATLGQYCACSHANVSEAALKLLHQLSSSRKLSLPSSAGNSRRLEKSRLLTALERDDHALTIASSLAALMRFDWREFEQGDRVPGFSIKLNLLRFLNRSLATAPGRPTIAHLLLGFTCSPDAVGEPLDGGLESADTLFGSIVWFLSQCPNGEERALWSWVAEIKYEAMSLLQKLWRSPLSSSITMASLRATDFVFAQILQEPTLRANTIWVDAFGAERGVDDPELFTNTTADALAYFLARRSALLEYIAAECRELAEIGAATVLNRLKLALSGWTLDEHGQKLSNASLQDFLDVFELEDALQVPLPESPYIDIDTIRACGNVVDAGLVEYDLGSIEQLLALQTAERRKAPTWTDLDQQNLESDQFNIRETILRNNRITFVRAVRQQYLKAWAQLIMLVLQACDHDEDQREAFVLQYLHLVLPRFESAIQSDQDAAGVLAQLVKSLLSNVPVGSLTDDGEGNAGTDAANERLFNTFRIAVAGIQVVGATTAVREMCCQICHAFIARLLNPKAIASRRRQAMQLIKGGGSRLLEILGDEAYSGSDSSRISALVALGSFIILSNRQASKHVVDILMRINFIQILVDGLGNVPQEMHNVNLQSDVDALPHQDAAVALLLSIAQTRHGATQVVNSGLFQAIQASGLFSADPDVGLDIDNPRALALYFHLMLALLRVVNAVVVSCGEENDQITGMAQAFIAQYRLSIVSIFKRSACIGSTNQGHEKVLAELVDNFTILMATCGFMEVSEDVQIICAGFPRQMLTGFPPQAEQEATHYQDRGQRLFT